jgi:signal transduction histidine kinase
MGQRRISLGTGHGQGAWPVLLLLVAAAVVPAACVLWFMNEAMTSQQLAVRQKLAGLSRGQLLAARDRLRDDWQARAEALATAANQSESAQAVFEDLVTRGVCDAALVYDRAGRLVYPEPREVVVAQPASESDAWGRATDLEYRQSSFLEAAQAYADLAAATDDVDLAAQALRGQARCLARSGRIADATDVLAGPLADLRYAGAVDTEGRLIAPDAQLHALQLMKDSAHPRYSETISSLTQRLMDFGDSRLTWPQRRFLIRRLKELAPATPDLPMPRGLPLAAAWLDSMPASAEPLQALPMFLHEGWPSGGGNGAASRLQPTHLEGVWQVSSPDRTVVALFTDRFIEASARRWLGPPGTVRLELVPPGGREAATRAFLAIPAGGLFPDWHLTVNVPAETLSQEIRAQTVVYQWAAAVVVLVIAYLATFIGRHVVRQNRLTRLKNDLIATVSHELKTPLASMRALVDTLLEGRYRDEQQVREYLGLVARENTRLSRLIDNFLTFSRMERNKRTFEFGDVRVEELVEASVGSVHERFSAGGCRLDVDVAENLPVLTGDRDALVTVLLNLLDNAYKYSDEDKHILLRAYTADGDVCLAVTDNGIGLSRRAMRRVFERFYQVDRTLSRRAGGCGLGLSIVKFIVDAHGGRIDVESRLGKGSTFTVRLPVDKRGRTDG